MTNDKLTRKEIENLLPHRDPMLLIDELIDIKKLQSATAIMNVKKDGFYVQGHFPGQPVMPGVRIFYKQSSLIYIFANFTKSVRFRIFIKQKHSHHLPHMTRQIYVFSFV